jgi:UDP-glucose 4-epimerase
MNILVVGGAGYIGSHMVKQLLDSGHDVSALDNLSNGHRDAVLDGHFIEGDVGDRELVTQLMTATRFDAVMHFASFIEVGESVRDPAGYYQNNVVNTKTLLDAMLDCGIKHFIFSSTAAIFGEPLYTPIDEAHPKDPINPYGRSKLMVEHLLEDYDRAYGLKSVALRYFNAAGADPGGYDTPDGTCVRDYVHVNDLCNAHLLALEFLQSGQQSGRFNLGNGQGFSVRQVIDCARQVTGVDFSVRQEKPREGDPAVLVADSTRARTELGWNPQYAELAKMIDSAWQWEQSFFLQ